MDKWILPISLSLAMVALPAIADPEKASKRNVVIVTSELSFIKFDGKFYLCDNDTPAEMKELGDHCVIINQDAFNYALKTTGADIMEMNIDVPKSEEPSAPVSTPEPVVQKKNDVKPEVKPEPVVAPAPTPAAPATVPAAKAPQNKPKS